MKFLLMVLTIGLLSCDVESVDSEIMSLTDDGSITTINGTWKAVSFENYNDETVIYPNEENSMGYAIVVTFDDRVKRDTLRGMNATNAIYGNFEYVSPRSVKINYVMSTKIAQPPLADEFAWALSGGALPYEVDRTTLRLYYQNRSRSITFARQ